jgi:hypothetical protein
MIDNISLLATSRNWIAPVEILPEVSWNFGGSLVQEFKLFKQKSTLTLDYYHTLFENQLIVDRDASINSILFKNLEGRSYSNSFQSEWAFSVIKNLEFRLAYKFLDVQAEYAGKMQQQVMIPKHRGFLNVGYLSRNKKWEYDFTISVFGSSRLPVADTTITTQNLEFSEIYPIANAQITYIYKKWDFYLGGENITNFKQNNPIIDSENPFGSKFDATRIWGPVMGINIYAGIRYSIKRKK